MLARLCTASDPPVAPCREVLPAATHLFTEVLEPSEGGSGCIEEGWRTPPPLACRVLLAPLFPWL